MVIDSPCLINIVCVFMFQMHVAVGEGVIARRVRVSFRAAHASPPRQQYYAVRGITLAARCLCHGQAENCEVNSQVKIYQQNKLCTRNTDSAHETLFHKGIRKHQKYKFFTEDTIFANYTF